MQGRGGSRGRVRYLGIVEDGCSHARTYLEWIVARPAIVFTSSCPQKPDVYIRVRVVEAELMGELLEARSL